MFHTLLNQLMTNFCVHEKPLAFCALEYVFKKSFVFLKSSV